MAPVPKETNKPSNDNMDDSLHNPSLTITPGEGNSDSSDEDYQDMVAPGSYSLLPSEPGYFQEDSDSDDEGESGRFAVLDPENDSQSLEGAASAAYSDAVSNIDHATDAVPNIVHATEAGSFSPSAHLSKDSSNPGAREKYPHGKIPSYLHVPSLPREKEGHLWNEQVASVKNATFDKGHESAILKAMSGFQLPPESIPTWAKNIPEEQWKQKIHSRIASCGETTNTPDLSLSHQSEESTLEHWVAEFPDNA